MNTNSSVEAEAHWKYIQGEYPSEMYHCIRYTELHVNTYHHKIVSSSLTPIKFTTTTIQLLGTSPRLLTELTTSTTP